MQIEMHRIYTTLCSVLLLVSGGAHVMANETLVLDDRSTGDEHANTGATWRLVTDGVMGGKSSGQLTVQRFDGRDCLRLQGDVSVANNGGFIQMALDIDADSARPVPDYTGIELDVSGNGEAYNLHLRTSDLWLPWQSWRTTFTAPAGWQTVRLPFNGFSAYRTGKTLSLDRLERIGLVAIGRAFTADLCVARVALY